MYKRYQGNTGRMEHIEERHGHSSPPSARPEPPKPQPGPRPSHPGQPTPPPPRPHRPSGNPPKGPGDPLGPLLSGMGLDTEDLLLLLILYLLYRESGDSELLMIIGAMFLL